MNDQRDDEAGEATAAAKVGPCGGLGRRERKELCRIGEVARFEFRQRLFRDEVDLRVPGAEEGRVLRKALGCFT